MLNFFIPRTPWPSIFPDVVIHATQKERDQHPAYKAAKAGDANAATRLVNDLMKEEALDNLRQGIGNKTPLLAAVSAIETTGFNAIPDAMAGWLNQKLGLEIEQGEIRQINKVAHTKAPGFRRLVTPAMFGGVVEQGRDYILIDDHVGLGGTLANMRGYIETEGGHVIIMTTLTETREARKISLTLETLNMLRLKHGQDLENLWTDSFGHGFNCLTNVEAGYLARQQSIDTIRGRLVTAAEEARNAGLSSLKIPDGNNVEGR